MEGFFIPIHGHTRATEHASVTVRALMLTTVSSLLSSAPYTPPPMIHIHANTLYDAGLQQGRIAGDRIRGWLATPEMRSLINYTLSDGRKAFQQLKHDNGKAFPSLLKELTGVAAGASVPLDHIWTATMINELESLRSPGPGEYNQGHCSDLYAVPDGGYASGFAHGHNEDWPGPIWRFWYLVAYHPASAAAEFEPCAGVVYPGGLVGWASSWNSKGIWLTQNSLFPKASRPGGLVSSFAQRAALCGVGSGTTIRTNGSEAATGPAPRAHAASSLEEVIQRLVAPEAVGVAGWSSAASVNIVSMHEKRMANVEVHLDRHARHDIRAHGSGANYSHFNMFKELEVGTADVPGVSSVHRQARVDALPAVRTRADIAARLSDSADAAYPIYRNMTLHTVILDGPTGRLDLWCCGLRASVDPPVYSWNLHKFFETD